LSSNTQHHLPLLETTLTSVFPSSNHGFVFPAPGCRKLRESFNCASLSSSQVNLSCFFFDLVQIFGLCFSLLVSSLESKCSELCCSGHGRLRRRRRMWGFGGRYYWGRKVASEKADGIVVVFAWMSSEEKHLMKYVDLYSSVGWNSLVCHSQFLNM